MARMGDIRRAVAERIGNIVDFEVYPFVPDAILAPCAWISPDRQFTDYQIDYGGSMTKWNLLITILVNRIDEESAQAELDDYLDPEGPFVAGLQEPGVGDTLAQITGDFVSVLYATNYGAYRVGDTDYYGVQLALEVRS